MTSTMIGRSQHDSHRPSLRLSKRRQSNLRWQLTHVRSCMQCMQGNMYSLVALTWFPSDMSQTLLRVPHVELVLIECMDSDKIMVDLQCSYVVVASMVGIPQFKKSTFKALQNMPAHTETIEKPKTTSSQPTRGCLCLLRRFDCWGLLQNYTFRPLLRPKPLEE